MATLQQQARALGDPTRHAIFRRIAEARLPVGIAELNEHFPFHHNAIRQHVAKLVAAGLVLESAVAGPGRGRPRRVYTVNPAIEGRWGTTGPYERLSLLLVEIIRTGLDAREVGRRAAGRFRLPAPAGEVVADISAAMARQGFDPEVRPGGPEPGDTEIVLRRCPFATAADADRATVCALHLGIAEGLAEGTPAVVDELVARSPREAGCRLRVRAGGGEPAPGAPPGILSLRDRPTAR